MYIIITSRNQDLRQWAEHLRNLVSSTEPIYQRMSSLIPIADSLLSGLFLIDFYSDLNGVIPVTFRWRFGVRSNQKMHCFFVHHIFREPISRFISGYYTVNKLIFNHNKYGKKPYLHPKLFTFYNITGEPERVLEFIRNLMEFGYDFLGRISTKTWQINR